MGSKKFKGNPIVTNPDEVQQLGLILLRCRYIVKDTADLWQDEDVYLRHMAASNKQLEKDYSYLIQLTERYRLLDMKWTLIAAREDGHYMFQKIFGKIEIFEPHKMPYAAVCRIISELLDRDVQSLEKSFKHLRDQQSRKIKRSPRKKEVEVLA